MLIIQIVIDHTPDRSITGTGYCCYDLYGMLTIKNVIDAVSAADFYRIDMIQVKVFNSFLNVLHREITLIILAGNKVFDRYLFKYDIRYIFRVIFHFSSPPICSLLLLRLK